MIPLSAGVEVRVTVGEGAAITVAAGKGLAMMRFTAPPFSVVKKAELL